MPVFSYIVYPEKGQKNELLSNLSAIEHCEVIPARNEEVLVLVTDTPDERTENELQSHIKELKSLMSLSMIFGHTDDQPWDKKNIQGA